MSDRRTGEEQHGEDGDADHEYRAEMRLEHQKDGEHGGHEENRTDRDRGLFDRPPRAAEQIGNEEHQRELEEL